MNTTPLARKQSIPHQTVSRLLHLLIRVKTALLQLGVAARRGVLGGAWRAWSTELVETVRDGSTGVTEGKWRRGCNGHDWTLAFCSVTVDWGTGLEKSSSFRRCDEGLGRQRRLEAVKGASCEKTTSTNEGVAEWCLIQILTL